MKTHHQGGLTLPELLISLTLISTLSVNGISQFKHTIQENRMAAEINRMDTLKDALTRITTALTR